MPRESIVITKDQAFELVQETLADDMGILYENTIELGYGWVIFDQTIKYIETKDIEYMAIGSGGMLVEKETGKIYQFGSAYSLEQNIKIYELGYLSFDDWDIEILEVHDEEETANYLDKLGIT